ncbi:MAG: amidohydrolase family protein [Methanobacteriota archaeon]
MQYVQGDILTQDGFRSGHLGFNEDGVIEQGKGSPPKPPIAQGIIVPGFINMHTHIGDSFIKKKHPVLPHTVEELVAPPNGLKHQLLHTATEEEIITGMQESLQVMKQSGTICFCDFREDGLQGLNQLSKTQSTQPTIKAVLLARPQTLSYNAQELRAILEKSQGIGLSSISDWEYSELQKIAQETKHHRHKLFAIHASETTRENIDLILDLHPDLLIHMIHATESDLERVKQENIPIVLCPRSNTYFGLTPKYHLMKESGVTLLLGTDNAMITPPNILQELAYIKDTTKEFTLDELFNMITYTPRKVLNQDAYIQVPNLSSTFIVIERVTLKPIYISSNKRGLT